MPISRPKSIILCHCVMLKISSAPTILPKMNQLVPETVVSEILNHFANTFTVSRNETRTIEILWYEIRLLWVFIKCSKNNATALNGLFLCQGFPKKY